MKRKWKIDYDGNEIFFCDTASKTALRQAEEFMDQNKDKHELWLYQVNEHNSGEYYRLAQHIDCVIA